MAYIDDDIIVKFGDGKLRFQNPGRRAWLVLNNLGKGEDGKPLADEDAYKQLWDLLVSVENLSKKDGTPVTVETLRALDHPPLFYHQAARGYMQALTDHIQGRADDPKNG
jgi:hypothetical protein